MRIIEDTFKNILDGPFTCLGISSQFPDDIIELLEAQKFSGNTPSVVLDNGDVWRYGNDPKLLEYLGNDPRKFYIITLGYDNRKILDNVYELSWPAHYFTRPRNKIPNLTKIKYGFSCLNNRSSFHRLVLGQALWKNKLLKDMIFTQNLVYLPCGYYEVLMDKIDGMSDYLSILPISWHDDRVQYSGGDYTINHPAYSGAWCNIVTESEIQEFVFEGPVVDLPTVTEKSYKPLMSKQIPIWLAAPGHCKYLRSLGFETMEDVLPDGYDDLGLFDKVDAIVQTVAKGRSYAEEFYHTHLKEIEHNYRLTQSDHVDNRIIDNIKNFLAVQ